MASFFEFILNGRSLRVENFSPNTTLLEYLRATGCTGTKEGCAEGDCGACSVAIIEKDAGGKNCFRAVNSCLMPLALVAGRTVITAGLKAKEQVVATGAYALKARLLKSQIGG